MIVTRQEDGFTILHGRKEEWWIIAPWWPCSGRALRKVAASRLPKEFVDEAAAFADETICQHLRNMAERVERKMSELPSPEDGGRS